MELDTRRRPSSRSARSHTEVLAWASTPPEGAVLTELVIRTTISGRGYRVFVQMQWERPPLAPRWVDRRVTHEMTASATHSFDTRPSPADILAAIASTVKGISTCPVVREMPGQEPLPGL
jgi:hypothetical protein